MDKTLVVVLGAGASYDVIPVIHRRNTVKSSSYAPPLTRDLFNINAEVQKDILSGYPAAQAAASNLRVEVGKKRDIEEILREMKGSPETRIQEQMKEIPLYLQELFAQISDLYTDEPVNYNILLNKTLVSSISHTMFVTINYDLLLEKALRSEHTSFNSIGDYVPKNKNWSLIKLHGSVNWGKKLLVTPNKSGTLSGLLDNIHQIDIENDLDGEIVVDSTYLTRQNITNPMYPALSVPVDKEYKLNCPEEHIHHLQTFLPKCKNYLIIGVSGKDEDLLGFLEGDVKNVGSVGIVGTENVAEAKEKILDSVPQFRGNVRTYTSGFSDFIANNIDSFLSQMS